MRPAIGAAHRPDAGGAGSIEPKGATVAARRRGFSLVEMLIVVVIIGIMLSIGFPKLRAGMINNNVRAARTGLINAIAAARNAGSQTNRSTWVKVSGSRVFVLARPRLFTVAGSDADTIGPVQNMDGLYGVSITPSVDSFRFNPTLTSLDVVGKSFILTKSGFADTVSIDGLGRVSK
jgi:prepilin-type N-terminal cleavage/methylation domain-containing protein